MMRDEKGEMAGRVAERRLAEQRLHRLNRLHTVLSKIGEAIVRTRDRQELYDAVCRIVVENGLLRMVFIAELDAEAKRAHPVASFGAGREYLLEPTSAIPVEEGPLSRGTVGTALRTGVHDVCNDISAAPRMKPWHATALENGLLANASFPLKLKGAVVSVLVLYAGETGYFLDDEIQLMVTVANSISFALESLEKERHRTEAEKALRESEGRFRSMFSTAATGIAISTPQGRFLQVNAAYCRMLGYTEDEMLQRDFASLTHPDDLPLNLKLRDEVLAGVRDSFVMEKRYIKKNGDIVWTSHSVSATRAADGEITALTVIAEDITERKRSEEALRSRQAELQVLFDLVPAMLCFKDTNNVFLHVNRRLADAAGKSVEELEGLHAREIYPQEADKYYADDLEVIRSRKPKLGIVETLRGPDGGERWVQTDKVPVFGADGEVTGIVVMVQDITARKEAEGRLLWKTTFFEAMVHSAEDAILVVNSDGQKILHNRRLIELWDIPDELANEADHRARFKWMTGQVMNPDAFVKKVAHLYAHPDEVSHDELHLRNGKCLDRLSAPVRGADGQHYGRIWVYRDVTERKKLEEQLRQIQKMDSIGTLAAGVAHDFNNILGVIQMQADALKSEAGLPPAQAAIVRGIGEAAQRATALTRQLLMFSRKSTLQPRDLDLNQSVDGIASMLRRILGEDVRLELNASKQPLFVHADAGMMDQALMNLAANARDAMPKGGRLIIETSAVEFDENVGVRSAQARPGAFACVSVSDTGSGISEENLQRIFEPFFTTKEVGKGTGLGLATLFGIVQQHSGWVEVSSEVGRGTTFRIYLPRLAGMSAQKTAPSAETPVRGGAETILLVEDDEFLRPFTCRVIEKLGYRVLAVGDGPEALEAWKRHRDEIHLLLTDMIMPSGMSGRELGERLARENPRLKVIYASGYSPEFVSKDSFLEEGVNFIAKPFQAQKLARIIRQSLDAR
jgi:PAS domain S-box-containing protein